MADADRIIPHQLHDAHNALPRQRGVERPRRIGVRLIGRRVDSRLFASHNVMLNDNDMEFAIDVAAHHSDRTRRAVAAWRNKTESVVVVGGGEYAHECAVEPMVE